MLDDDNVAAVCPRQNLVGENLMGASLRDHTAIETNHPRQMRRYGVQIVRCQYNGNAFTIDVVQQVQYFVLRSDIDPRGRFVEYQKLRIVDQRAPEMRVGADRPINFRQDAASNPECPAGAQSPEFCRAPFYSAKARCGRWYKAPW